VVSTRKSRAVLTVVLGVAVILGYVVWTAVRNATPATTSQAAATTTRANTAKPTTSSGSKTTIDPETKLPWIDVADLPSQGRAVLASIDKGGPYPYSQDGGTFTNAEKLLPLEAKGFYTEYTVKLPSSSDRGPVRIIMGGKGRWYFWTDDHYASFSRIRR
jgi:ribonuclease T1